MCVFRFRFSMRAITDRLLAVRPRDAFSVELKQQAQGMQGKLIRLTIKTAAFRSLCDHTLAKALVPPYFIAPTTSALHPFRQDCCNVGLMSLPKLPICQVISTCELFLCLKRRGLWFNLAVVASLFRPSFSLPVLEFARFSRTPSPT